MREARTVPERESDIPSREQTPPSPPGRSAPLQGIPHRNTDSAMSKRVSAAAAAARRDPPRSRHLTANRLRHHLLEWGGAGPVVLLLHGFLEHAHAWDLVAPRIVAAGYRVYALDWRGHGDSEWIGAGGYYHFADYAADLAAIVPQLAERVALVAHSMGGGAAVNYAGTWPERVSALVSVEGLGIPDSDPDGAPDRFRAWIDDLTRAAEREPRRLTLDAATGRLHQGVFRFSAAVARQMAEHGTRADGEARVWKFDPLHQTRSPQPYYVVQARAFWRRVTCPVLYVDGGNSTLALPATELEERLRILRARRVTIDGAGHHPHLEQPERFADVLVQFLRNALPSAGPAPSADLGDNGYR
jgi:pimeloyl-ACP methyl ester carboxylesterase